MDFENNLKSCLKGDGKAPLATVRCSDNFNMRSVIVTRESLWRLCGYGSTSADRYLDDQVRPAVTILMFVVNNKKTGTGGEWYWYKIKCSLQELRYNNCKMIYAFQCI